jgi:radical SAM protein with 4Fe4S-binding SPASM domain
MRNPKNGVTEYANLAKVSDRQFSMIKNYLNEDLFVDEFPKYLVIEPTNYCNLNCIMCPRKDMTRTQGLMQFSLFRKIIDESIGNVDFIYLHFFGEPLLHPEIIDFINYAGGKGMTVALSTNATVLSGKDAQTFEKIRPGGNFENILKNINDFLKLQQSSDSTLNVSLQLIESSLNKHEIERFRSHWKERGGLSLAIKPLYDYAGQVREIEKIGDFSGKKDSNKVCIEPWRGLVIGWDGIIIPCCNDFNYKYPLGDARTNTIKEIWNSKNMVALRYAQIHGLQYSNELCRGCLIHDEDMLTAISLNSSFNPTRKESRTYFDKGLYPDEIDRNNENQWTHKYFEISVQDKFNDITFIFCNENPHKEEVEVEILLFDHSLKKAVIGRRTEIILCPPEKYKGRLLRYGFLLSDDWVPRQEGINEDSRRLGIRIEKIIN